MRYWNNRIIRRPAAFGEGYDYAVHEVHYDDEDRPRAWTAEPVVVSGNTLDELREDLARKHEALEHPVLEERPHPSGEGEQLCPATA